jgi:hypothetical protein
MVTAFQEAVSRIKEETGQQSVTFVLRAEADYPAKGINRGDYLTVEALNPQANTLMVRSQKGKRFVLNPAENSKLSVYQKNIKPSTDGLARSSPWTARSRLLLSTTQKT